MSPTLSPAVGEMPLAVDTAGISVPWLRYRAVLLCGLFAGLAGAYLSIAQNAGFSRDMTAGQGFIALAAIIFGKWRPFPAFGANATPSSAGRAATGAGNTAGGAIDAIGAAIVTAAIRCGEFLEIRSFIPLSDEISRESTVEPSSISISFLT